MYLYRSSLPKKLFSIDEEEEGKEVDYDDDSFEADLGYYDDNLTHKNHDNDLDNTLNSGETVNSSFGDSFGMDDTQNDSSYLGHTLSQETEVLLSRKKISKRWWLVPPYSCFKRWWDYTMAFLIVNF